MQTVAELYARSGLPTATLVADPAMVLIENTETHFGLLLAEGCWEDSFSNRLMLDRVRWLRVSKRGLRMLDMSAVRLESVDGLCAAREEISRLWLPNMSTVPYKLFFLSSNEYVRLLAHLDKGTGKPVFLAAQKRYAALPGFGARDLGLTSPENYAMVSPDADANLALRAG